MVRDHRAGIPRLHREAAARSDHAGVKAAIVSYDMVQELIVIVDSDRLAWFGVDGIRNKHVILQHAIRNGAASVIEV